MHQLLDKRDDQPMQVGRKGKLHSQNSSRPTQEVYASHQTQFTKEEHDFTRRVFETVQQSCKEHAQNQQPQSQHHHTSICLVMMIDRLLLLCEGRQSQTDHVDHSSSSSHKHVTPTAPHVDNRPPPRKGYQHRRYDPLPNSLQKQVEHVKQTHTCPITVVDEQINQLVEIANAHQHHPRKRNHLYRIRPELTQQTRHLTPKTNCQHHPQRHEQHVNRYEVLVNSKMTIVIDDCKGQSNLLSVIDKLLHLRIAGIQIKEPLITDLQLHQLHMLHALPLPPQPKSLPLEQQLHLLLTARFQHEGGVE